MKPLDNEAFEKLMDSMDQLIELETKKIGTLKELKKYYRVAHLVGRHPKDMKGARFEVRNRRSKPFTPTCRLWLNKELVVSFTSDEDTAVINNLVKRAGVEPMVWPLKDVHLDLWPEDIRAQYEKREAATKAKERETLIKIQNGECA